MHKGIEAAAHTHFSDLRLSGLLQMVRTSLKGEPSYLHRECKQNTKYCHQQCICLAIRRHHCSTGLHLLWCDTITHALQQLQLSVVNTVTRRNLEHVTPELTVAGWKTTRTRGVVCRPTSCQCRLDETIWLTYSSAAAAAAAAAAVGRPFDVVFLLWQKGPKVWVRMICRLMCLLQNHLCHLSMYGLIAVVGRRKWAMASGSEVFPSSMESKEMHLLPLNACCQ